MQLAEVKAIVTGAASGLGYCFALELCRAGAAVVAVDVNGAGLDRLSAAAAGLPGPLLPRMGDVSDEAAVKAFVREGSTSMGGLNVVVNNAGVLLDGLLVKEEEGWVRRLPLTQLRKVLDVNLVGAFLVAREGAADMLERGVRDGVVVNLSSLARVGNAGQAAYAASKAGLDAATRTWAVELAPHGIRVAGIAPGVIQTPILENISDQARDALRAAIPLGRFGDPLEVWLTLRYVIECGFFTGRVIEIDGGAHM